jgi:hypothetical protein
MSFKIPSKIRDEFIGYMDVANDDDAPDGAWFAMLECAAEEFMRKNRVHWGDGNDGAHYYLELKAKEQEQS